MMATAILMPKQGNSVESCLIVSWKKQKGDSVNIGDVLCEVETDKAVMDVESTASGVLLETFFAAGDDVPVQTVIAVVGSVGESVAEFLNDSRGAGELRGGKSSSTNDQVPVGFSTSKALLEIKLLNFYDSRLNKPTDRFFYGLH